MPRASYGDKFTVTVMKNGESDDGNDDDEKHSVLDLSSKVIDFELIPESSILVVLAEEELVVVDLSVDSWPVVPSPYLNAIHASAVTCLTHADEVAPKVMDCLREVAAKNEKVAGSRWPANGGKLQEAKPREEGQELLLTGHEDGSVKIWSCTGIALSPLATVRTNRYFIGDELDEPPEDAEEEEEEEEWPPFKKVGSYDPYSDDPRLAVKKVAFCSKSGRLVIGGTAGQVAVLELADVTAEQSPEEPVKVKTDLVTEKEGFTWKGHNPLVMREKTKKSTAAEGFRAKTLLQISPPASVNSLALNMTWGVVAAGTAHGLVILDALLSQTVLAKCTLNAHGKYCTVSLFPRS